MSTTAWIGLTETARVVRDAARRLARALLPDAPERFVGAIQQMAARAEQFADAVAKPEPPDLADHRVRHDLRNDVGVLINYGDFWLKRRADPPFSPYAADLTSLVTAARRALEQLDSLIAAVTSGGMARPAFRSPAPPVAPLPPAQRGRILVVDDNHDNRNILQDLLELQGHTVTPAASGIEALELLERQPFDLILLDVVMPKMGGFAVLERLKADPAWRDIPVLMVSALDRLDSVVEGIARGAEDYLTRPFEERLLRARIGACLEKKRLRDSEVESQRQIDRLLHAIFPHEVVRELTEKGQIAPRRSDKVGVCFVDIVGFTAYCDRHAGKPEEVVGKLEWYVEAFEQVARQHGAQKIKTIGDAFLMVSGLLHPIANPVLQLVLTSAELLERVRHGPAGWQVRIGIHVGPVVAGTLGESQYSYDLWGSTVNIAARMQSVGKPGVITMSEKAWAEIRHLCKGQQRDAAVRGIGPMPVWEFLGFQEDKLAEIVAIDRAHLSGTAGANGAGGGGRRG